MNDQTFHTPSFGDEEFDIPQFNHHLGTMDQTQYHQHLDPTQQQQQQQSAPQYVHQAPQWHDMNAGGGYGMHQQSPYLQMGQQQQNNHYQAGAATHMSPQGNSNQTGPPPTTYHTMGQSPHNMQQTPAAQQTSNPLHQQQSSVIVENGVGSEDSDDAIPVSN